MRLTESRQAIYHAVTSSQEPIDARSIHNILPHRPNLSTVYRSLEYLESHGMVRSIAPFDGTRYYYSNHAHGHFIVCMECRSISTFPHCPAGEVQHDLENESGYEIADHVLLFRGVCEGCKHAK